MTTTSGLSPEIIAMLGVSTEAVVISTKLIRALGKEKAEASIRWALLDAQLEGVNSPQDLLRFAVALMKREPRGLALVVGHALKVHALLRGAKADE